MVHTPHDTLFKTRRKFDRRVNATEHRELGLITTWLSILAQRGQDVSTGGTAGGSARHMGTLSASSAHFSVKLKHSEK